MHRRASRRLLVCAIVGVAPALGAVACDSESTSLQASEGPRVAPVDDTSRERDDAADAANDGGGSADAPTDAPPDAASDATVMSCTTFEDRTASDASRELTWDFTFPSTKERCLLVRVGQTVLFGNGAGGPAAFAIHSVQASGGDVPSPVEALDLLSGTVTLDRAGTFGFFCVDHRTMRGAIRAVP